VAVQTAVEWVHWTSIKHSLAVDDMIYDNLLGFRKEKNPNQSFISFSKFSVVFLHTLTFHIWHFLVTRVCTLLKLSWIHVLLRLIRPVFRQS